VKQSQSIGMCHRPKKQRALPRRRLQCLCRDGACRGCHVRSGGHSDGHGDEGDDSCSNFGNGKSRLGCHGLGGDC
jgi:hypothetical protein